MIHPRSQPEPSEPDPHSEARAVRNDSARSGDGGEFAPGSRIAGKYLVDGKIGEGARGVVVRARHVELDQPVAIRYLKPHAVHSGVVERFVREARLAARIKSEHAVRVHDVETLANGIPYVAMEYLEGRDLRQVLADGPVPLQQAIEYVLQASEALAEAHAVGILHRDLKPDHLFLAQRPGGAFIVKVFDLGISKAGGLASARPDAALTQVIDRLGTPTYMSPEQLQGADVDARSDIWGLGVVLYELVTGRLPFEGADAAQLCAAILTKPHVPVQALVADAPDELDAIIGRCLEKDPASRYRNVAELAQDLAEIWEDESPSRVKLIAQMIRAAGQTIRPPTFAGQIPVQSPPTIPSIEAPFARCSSDSIDPMESAPRALVGVFMNVAGDVVDELSFASLEDAYDHAWSRGTDVVRCELYEEFSGVRGAHRVTYVRKGQTELWVPLLAPL